MQNAPPDAAVARFRRDLLSLVAPAKAGAAAALDSQTGPRLREGDVFGVAVSGGPDSLALLLLCDAAFPGQTYAATFDHGLRPESANEAAFVTLLCQSMGVPHAVLHPAEPPSGNLQDWARKQRYAALESWAADRGLAAILTGHHADDQLETMVMRLNRGSGVAGLSGIRARQGQVVRPLLGWRREELVALVGAAGLIPVDDPSNRDDRFDRARLRKALVQADWLDAAAASRSAAALAEAEAALEWTADGIFAERVDESDTVLRLNLKGVPNELRRRLVLRALRAFNPEAAPRGEELARLLASLSDGEIATLAGVRCEGGATWRFSRAAARNKN